jgi:uncharacterized membrane protein (DUF2068 family)
MAFFGGFFGLCLPILAFTGSGQFGGILGSIGALAGTFLLIGPLLQIIFAVGAFGLKRWAWYLGLIATGISVIGVIINLFEGASFPVIVSSVISVIIFIYLLLPRVREAFGI